MSVQILHHCSLGEFAWTAVVCMDLGFPLPCAAAAILCSALLRQKCILLNVVKTCVMSVLGTCYIIGCLTVFISYLIQELVEGKLKQRIIAFSEASTHVNFKCLLYHTDL